MLDMPRIIEIAVTAVALLSLLFLVWSSYTTSLLGKDFWVWLPVFGKMARWSRGDERTGVGNDSLGKLIPVEKALYDYYKNGVPEIARGKFEQYRKYLTLSDQSDRKPMSAWIWAVLFALTIAEAFGTGALVAPVVAREITPDGALYYGAGIALVLAIVTLFFTHSAGHDLYYNSIVSRIYTDYKRSGGFVVGGQSEPVASIGVIGPEDDQDQDKANASISRMASRLKINTQGVKKKKLSIIGATALIIAAFILTTWYRHDELNRHLDSEAAGLSSVQTPASGGTQNFQNMFSSPSATPAAGGLPLPAAVARAANQSQKRATDAIISDKKGANDVGTILLGVIYLFTQLLGVITGYKYGFFSGDAEKAYRATMGYTDYDLFLNYVIAPVKQRANIRMATLQNNLVKLNASYKPTAFDFMRMYAADTRPLQEELADPSPTGQEQLAAPLVWSDARMQDLAERTLSLASKEERASFVSSQKLSGKDMERFRLALADAKERRKSTGANGLSQDILDALED